MKTINFLNTELEINYTQALTAGHGHKKITVELFFQGKYKTFSSTTSNMSDYDDAVELDGGDKDEALFNIISYKIEDEVSEWISEIENNITTYVIADYTCTNQAIYMDQDMSGCADINDAKQYKTEEEAQSVIDDNDYGDWAYVVKND